jgi:hypothetical protein
VIPGKYHGKQNLKAKSGCLKKCNVWVKWALHFLKGPPFKEEKKCAIR